MLMTSASCRTTPAVRLVIWDASKGEVCRGSTDPTKQSLMLPSLYCTYGHKNCCFFQQKKKNYLKKKMLKKKSAKEKKLFFSLQCTCEKHKKNVTEPTAQSLIAPDFVLHLRQQKSKPFISHTHQHFSHNYSLKIFETCGQKNLNHLFRIPIAFFT